MLKQKVDQIDPKLPEINLTTFYLKVAPKVSEYFNYFCKKNCIQKL